MDNFPAFLSALQDRRRLHLAHKDAGCDALGSAYALSRVLPGDIGSAQGLKASARDLAHERRKAVRACYELLGAGGLFIAFENIASCTPCGNGSGGLPCYSSGNPLDPLPNPLSAFSCHFLPNAMPPVR